jgi:hypothetical protein
MAVSAVEMTACVNTVLSVLLVVVEVGAVRMVLVFVVRGERGQG